MSYKFRSPFVRALLIGSIVIPLLYHLRTSYYSTKLTTIDHHQANKIQNNQRTSEQAQITKLSQGSHTDRGNQEITEELKGNQIVEPAKRNHSFSGQIANAMDASYHNLGVRLGTDLNFDLNRCPKNSYMLNRDQHSIPKHQDCPTLFIVGARKGGTTSLIQYISKHPDFEAANLDKGPQAGETFYFGKCYNEMTWKNYTSLFPQRVMSGDSSVENLVHSAAPKRIFSDCGEKVKAVMLFRDPIKRMVSAFLMRVRLGKMSNESHLSPYLSRNLEKFNSVIRSRIVDEDSLPDVWSRLVGLFNPASNILYEGLYYVHLLNWLCNFPAENILIIRSEEFFQKPSKILDTVVQFLGLKRLDMETYDNITSVSYNSGKYDVPEYQKMTPSEEKTFLEIFWPYNKVLLEFLQWDNSQWLHD